mgnify:CR=1 FL=1
MKTTRELQPRERAYANDYHNLLLENLLLNCKCLISVFPKKRKQPKEQTGNKNFKNSKMKTSAEHIWTRKTSTIFRSCHLEMSVVWGHYYPNRSLFNIVKSTGNSDNLLCRMNILSNKHTCTIEDITLFGRNFLIWKIISIFPYIFAPNFEVWNKKIWIG